MGWHCITAVPGLVQAVHWDNLFVQNSVRFEVADPDFSSIVQYLCSLYANTARGCKSQGEKYTEILVWNISNTDRHAWALIFKFDASIFEQVHIGKIYIVILVYGMCSTVMVNKTWVNGLKLNCYWSKGIEKHMNK